MMKAKIFTTLALVIAIGISNVNAQIVHREINQSRRIHQGVRSGELTKSEAVNLRTGQRETRQDVRAAKADGKITGRERREIRRDQKRESRKIFRKKHNGRDRH